MGFLLDWSPFEKLVKIIFGTQWIGIGIGCLNKGNVIYYFSYVKGQNSYIM